MSKFKVGDSVITRWGEAARSIDLEPGMVQDGEHVIIEIDYDWGAARLDTPNGWWYPLSLLEKIDDAPAAKDDGGSAFPLQASFAGGEYFPGTDGMSLRDYFAAKAIQSILSIGDANANMFLSKPRGRELTQWLAEDAYAYADAMLEARKK